VEQDQSLPRQLLVEQRLAIAPLEGANVSMKTSHLAISSTSAQMAQLLPRHALMVWYGTRRRVSAIGLTRPIVA